MPYVPSNDRPALDKAVDVEATKIASHVNENFALIREYRYSFGQVAHGLGELVIGRPCVSPLAQTIYDAGAKHGYQGAFLGELNYAITRLIQRVPQKMLENGTWKDEFRYWIYAATVEALIYMSAETIGWTIGISGVFEDIKDEYKRRVNPAYEGVQIVKSGDCYDTPYYTRLVPVVDTNNRHVGYMEVQLDRSKVALDERKDPDVLGYELVLRQVVKK